MSGILYICTVTRALLCYIPGPPRGTALVLTHSWSLTGCLPPVGRPCQSQQCGCCFSHPVASSQASGLCDCNKHNRSFKKKGDFNIGWCKLISWYRKKVCLAEIKGKKWKNLKGLQRSRQRGKRNSLLKIYFWDEWLRKQEPLTCSAATFASFHRRLRRRLRINGSRAKNHFFSSDQRHLNVKTNQIEWLWQKSKAEMICLKNFLASFGVSRPFFTR